MLLFDTMPIQNSEKRIDRKTWFSVRVLLGLSMAITAITFLSAAHAAPGKITLNKVPPGKATPATVVQARVAPGWTMKQTSMTQSDQEISACNKFGLKIKPLRGGQTYLFAPPYNQILVWNEDTKKCCKIPMKTFKSAMQTTKNVLDGQSLNAIPLQKAREGKLHGLDTVEYKETAEYANNQMERFKKKEAPSRIAQHIEYTTSDKFDLDPIIYRCITTFYGYPARPAMPVSFIYYDLDRDRKTQLTTGQIARATFTQKDFAMPRGLKVVADEHKVAETATYNEAIEMMLPGQEK